MEPITTLYVGTGTAIVIGLIMGAIVLPILINKLFQTDEGCEPIGSISDIDTINQLTNEILDSPEYIAEQRQIQRQSRARIQRQAQVQRTFILEEELYLDLMDIEDEPLEYYNMPLPADPRARVELSPIEQEMREAEEYAKLHNKNKLKVDEAVDNINIY